MLAFIEYLLVKAVMMILIPLVFIFYYFTKPLRYDSTNARIVADMKKLWRYKNFDEEI